MPKREKKPPLIDPQLVRALGHPARIEILDALTGRTMSPNQLKDVIDLPLSHTSYHVRALEKCGAVELVGTRQRRGATEHFYRTSPKSFLGSPRWRTVPKVFLRAVSGASLQGFIDRAVNALQAGNLDQEAAATTWLPLAIDDQGKREAREICAAATADLLEVQKRSQRRLGGARDKATPYVAAVMAFEAASP